MTPMGEALINAIKLKKKARDENADKKFQDMLNERVKKLGKGILEKGRQKAMEGKDVSSD